MLRVATVEMGKRSKIQPPIDGIAQLTGIVVGIIEGAALMPVAGGDRPRLRRGHVDADLGEEILHLLLTAHL